METQVQALQAQLAQRPPLEAVQELQKEYKDLELLLEGILFHKRTMTRSGEQVLVSRNDARERTIHDPDRTVRFYPLYTTGMEHAFRRGRFLECPCL